MGVSEKFVQTVYCQALEYLNRPIEINSTYCVGYLLRCNSKSESHNSEE